MSKVSSHSSHSSTHSSSSRSNSSGSSSSSKSHSSSSSHKSSSSHESSSSHKSSSCHKSSSHHDSSSQSGLTDAQQGWLKQVGAANNADYQAGVADGSINSTEQADIAAKRAALASTIASGDANKAAWMIQGLRGTIDSYRSN